MAAAAAPPHELDAAKCTLCRLLGTLPCSGPCAHPLCLRGAQQVYRAPGAKKCPTCSAPLPKSAGDLKPNHAMEQMLSCLHPPPLAALR